MFDPFGYAMLFAALHAVFFIGYLGNSSTFPQTPNPGRRDKIH